MTFDELETRLFSQTAEETAALQVLPQTLRLAELPETELAEAAQCTGQAPGLFQYELDARGFTPTELMFESQRGMFHIAQHNRYRAEPIHRHRFFEVIIVYAGQCTLRIEDSVCRMQTGDVCLLNLNTPHRISPLGAGDIVLCIRMKQELMTGPRMENTVGEIPLMQQFYFARARGETVPPYLMLHCAARASFFAIVRLMTCEYFESDMLSFSVLIGFFAPFFAELSRVWQPLTPEVKTTRLDQVLNYIKRYYRVCTVEETAQRFGYSPTYLSALIRQHTGQSFSELRRLYRLENAAELLQSSREPVGNIAASVGYSNLTWFYRAFRAQYGMTPREYRNSRTL